MHRISVLILVVVVGGCAQLAKKTPTPAAEVKPIDLEHAPAPPGERYYALIFGSQSEPIVPRKTHTWATVVRVVDPGTGSAPTIDPQTISWMPATMEIRPWRFRVEPGTNLDLHATVNEVQSQNQRISMWGPYELRTGLYRKFLMQKEFMESGQVGYQCVDTVGEAARQGNGCDCIHAITDLDSEFDRGTYWLFRYGERASEFIVEQIALRKMFIDPCLTHDWLIEPLGLNQCGIERRPMPTPSLALRMGARMKSRQSRVEKQLRMLAPTAIWSRITILENAGLAV